MCTLFVIILWTYYHIIWVWQMRVLIEVKNFLIWTSTQEVAPAKMFSIITVNLCPISKIVINVLLRWRIVIMLFVRYPLATLCW